MHERESVQNAVTPCMCKYSTHTALLSHTFRDNATPTEGNIIILLCICLELYRGTPILDVLNFQENYNYTQELQTKHIINIIYIPK